MSDLLSPEVVSAAAEERFEIAAGKLTIKAVSKVYKAVEKSVTQDHPSANRDPIEIENTRYLVEATFGPDKHRLPFEPTNEQLAADFQTVVLDDGQVVLMTNTAYQDYQDTANLCHDGCSAYLNPDGTCYIFGPDGSPASEMELTPIESRIDEREYMTQVNDFLEHLNITKEDIRELPMHPTVWNIADSSELRQDSNNSTYLHIESDKLYREFLENKCRESSEGIQYRINDDGSLDIYQK